jgi:hypothetical protein
MQLSGAPTKVTVPFANSGTKNTIPTASQIGVTPGAASYTDGFPPLTFTPLASGGVPPAGADFNGILNAITQAVRWQMAGGGYTYDSTFSTAVGGYPKSALLANTAGTGYWFNTVDNNTVNPDTVGTGWVALNTQTTNDARYAAIGGNAAQAFAVANASIASQALAAGQMQGQLLATRTFTASGTYTPTSGTKRVLILCVGGGGGGGGAQGGGAGTLSIGGGGGAGGWSITQWNSPATVGITIGAAGTSGAAGGTTTVAGVANATGGSGGIVGATITTVSVSAIGGLSGAASLGQIGFFGEPGGIGFSISTVAGMSGKGGSSAYGGGGAPAYLNNTGVTNGNPAAGYGGGGSGAVGVNNGATATGGAGGLGVVVIYEFGGAF